MRQWLRTAARRLAEPDGRRRVRLWRRARQRPPAPARDRLAWLRLLASLAGLLTLPDLRRLALPGLPRGFRIPQRARPGLTRWFRMPRPALPDLRRRLRIPRPALPDLRRRLRIPRPALPDLRRWFRIPRLMRLRLPAWPGERVRWLLGSLRVLGRRLKPGRAGPLRTRARMTPPPPEAPPSASLALAFEQLCRTFGRPFSAAEIRAAAPPADQGMTLGNLLLAAERLGFKAAEVKPDALALTQMPPPFLVLGAQPGEGWLAEARIGDHLVLQDLEAGRAAAHHVETVADLAERVVLLKPLPAPVGQRQWRDTIMRRLSPVLWELGLASVVINLLALATPIFLMTVYNKVISHTKQYHPVP